MSKNLKVTPPMCASCGSRETNLVKGDKIYPHRGDLYDLNFWLCECGAYCGCHKTKLGGFKRPLGRTANKELRSARSHCHRVFDPIWKDAHKMSCYDDSEKDGVSIKIISNAARGRTYRYMASCMNLSKEECHIGMMDLDQCRQLYSICKRISPEDVRAWHKRQKQSAPLTDN